MALPRKLVSGETDDEPVEDIFLEAQQVAAQAEQLLVKAGWEHPTPKAETLDPVFLSGRGMMAIELIPGGSHHGLPEMQQSLFNWAEFLTEPDEQPQRRDGRDGQTVAVRLGAGA